ncbi:hypothetical protein CR162_16975 [Pseudoroseomonas rhizosphaerae]|uniref:Uncharacterized protein n=1 Tax=Teichococcus rhizosphaerae TaxID=1335062 RepID=A0A2C6XYR3_9PROT|nr:hypothetical protein [Pseudoroseomonas rhizosphaerae]PHK93682.1 hypothetical protein CR162_16975 [Pseudoroseomonas rhizosphaerae]
MVIGQGDAAFRHGAFLDRDAAQGWAAQAAEAKRACTVRIGSKRFLGTAAEALRRWAIDQGTLPRDEGGTQLAPLLRLAPLLEDPACAWPLGLLDAAELAALRRRRLAALDDLGAMLAEQAALFAALEMFRDFYLPALDDPFARIAPDGLCILDEASCAQAIAWGGQVSEDMGLAIGLMLTTAAPAEALRTCREAQADRLAGRLHLPGGLTLRPAGGLMPAPRKGAASLLLPGLPELAGMQRAVGEIGRRIGRPGLTTEALRLTALAGALCGGRHLDEVLLMAGARLSGQG